MKSSRFFDNKRKTRHLCLVIAHFVDDFTFKYFSCFNRKCNCGLYNLDVDECTETYEDEFGVVQKMHNCDLIDEASCEDTIGSFMCACGEGFRSQTGSEGQQICASELFTLFY